MLDKKVKDSIEQIVLDQIGFDPYNCTLADLNTYDDMNDLKKDCERVLRNKVNNIAAEKMYSSENTE